MLTIRLSIVWGILLACHGATNDFVSLTSIRVLLGILESTITPGFTLVTALWYKPSEHPLRTCLWFTGNSAGAVFGGLLAYAMGHINNGVASWRVSFPHPQPINACIDEDKSGYSLFSVLSLLHGVYCSTFTSQTHLSRRAGSTPNNASMQTAVLKQTKKLSRPRSGRRISSSKHSSTQRRGSYFSIQYLYVSPTAASQAYDPNHQCHIAATN